jgi:2-polyprenyl-3-methyl-5-hydroxy-6-metoxy-1,4-benzoquinol methylase
MDLERRIESSGRFGASFRIVTELQAGQLGPDSSAEGFVAGTVDPFRYDGQSNDPDEVVGVVSALIPRSARVLDVGCGTGSVSVHVMRNCDATLVGVEPDVSRAALARSRGIDVRGDFLTADLIRQLGSFDIVLFADVLEHLPQPLQLLNLAKTALGPNGRIIASVPNIAHWSVRAELLRGRFVYREWGIMDATHLRWFTDANLQRLFEAAGLTIEARRVTAGVDLQCYSELLPWRWMRRARRASLIRRAMNWWPTLFGCQFVVRSAPIIVAAQP